MVRHGDAANDAVFNVTPEQVRERMEALRTHIGQDRDLYDDFVYKARDKLKIANSPEEMTPNEHARVESLYTMSLDILSKAQLRRGVPAPNWKDEDMTNRLMMALDKASDAIMQHPSLRP